MNITYEGVALLVTDIDVSRGFYEKTLGQSVLADHGPHVAFVGGFSIWQADHASQVVFAGARSRPATLGADNMELYFESQDLDSAWAALMAGKPSPEVVHPIIVQPWLQRCFRVRDPDGHLVEIGEPLPVLVKRLKSEGLNAEQIASKTSIPLDGVNMMLGA
jgi:catechol 2,3-dioxygenase-like lactoylglutathione lyase family enzyme